MANAIYGIIEVPRDALSPIEEKRPTAVAMQAEIHESANDLEKATEVLNSTEDTSDYKSSKPA